MMEFKRAPKAWLANISAVALALLVAVHAIPGTGALRSLALLLILAYPAMLTLHSSAPPSFPAMGVSGWLLLALTGWMAGQSLLFATDTSAALKQFSSEWSKTLFMVFAGTALARATLYEVETRRLIVMGIFVGFFSHVVMTLGFHAWYFWQHGGLPVGISLIGNYGYVSPLVDGALAMLLAEMVLRFTERESQLPFSGWVLVGMISAAFASSLLLAAKASLLMNFVLVLVVGFVIIMRRNQSSRLWSSLTISGMILIVVAGLAFSNRWQGAIDSLQMGLDITRHQDWLSAQRPTNSTADESFYLRAAWAKVGIQGIGKYPWGLGYGTDAFGRLLTKEYGVTGFISSHSGWIDFGLANGLPGLGLFLALAVSLMLLGWRAFVLGNGAGLMLAMLVINYIGRCAIDGHLTTSRIGGFALMTGALWAVCSGSGPRHETGPD